MSSNNRKGSKRELLTSDESTDSIRDYENDEDFKRKKSKKTRPHKSDDEDLSINKRSSRKVKETDFDRQLRLAIEQSKKEAKENEMKRQIEMPQDSGKVDIPEKVITIDMSESPGVKTVADSKVMSSEKIPKQSRKKLADINLDTTDEEDTDYSKKIVESIEKNELICTEVVANEVDSSAALTKSSEKKPKQARKKIANINLDSTDDKESESVSNQEIKAFIGNEEISPTKRALSPVDSNVEKKNKSGEKKKPPKPRKKLADINLESSGDSDDSSADFSSGKKKPAKKKTPKKINKHPESKENSSELFKEPSTKRTLDMSESQPKPFQVITDDKSLHSLLPKHVSKLPPKNISVEAKQPHAECKKPPVNPVFKSVATSASVSNSSSPLGRIEIKNNSPCVRVGLSRNIKIPSLHKNVKPTL